LSRADSNTTRRRLVEVIGNCVYHALGLVETLQDERRALESQDMDALDIAISEKSKSVESLRLAEEQRKALCVAAGFPDGPEQMNDAIAWCDDYSVVANCWQHLLEIVTRCDSLNMSNGAIIRSRKTHVDASIAIIRGDSHNPSLYNRDGQNPARQSLRSIAEA
jgi:flagellar biosynthesis/type III secretory pathway chaperone